MTKYLAGLMLALSLVGCSESSDGCAPSTGEPGSAQYQRDLERCIEEGY